MSSSAQKWKISLFSAVVFLIVASPFLYGLTERLFSLINLETAQGGCPTGLGVVLHAVVFLLITRYSMDLDLF